MHAHSLLPVRILPPVLRPFARAGRRAGSGCPAGRAVCRPRRGPLRPEQSVLRRYGWSVFPLSGRLFGIIRPGGVLHLAQSPGRRGPQLGRLLPVQPLQFSGALVPRLPDAHRRDPAHSDQGRLRRAGHASVSAPPGGRVAFGAAQLGLGAERLPAGLFPEHHVDGCPDRSAADRLGHPAHFRRAFPLVISGESGGGHLLLLLHRLDALFVLSALFSLRPGHRRCGGP